MQAEGVLLLQASSRQRTCFLLYVAMNLSNSRSGLQSPAKLSSVPMSATSLGVSSLLTFRLQIQGFP